MKKKWQLFFFITISLFVLVNLYAFSAHAVDFTPSGNITLKSRYGVYNATNLTIESLKIASCDVKADDLGSLYCGTDDTGDTNVWTGNLTKANVTQERADNATIALNLTAQDNQERADNRTQDTKMISINSTLWAALLANSTYTNLIGVREAANNATQATLITANNNTLFDYIGLYTLGWSYSGTTLFNDSTGIAVGIGTSTPSEKLVVNGNLLVGLGNAYSKLQVVGNVSINGTLYVMGINLTGRQIDDNATIANNLSSLNTRINNQVTLNAANNATIVNNLSSLNTRINNQVSLNAANNATIAANLSSFNTRLNTEITLQAANNATQLARINADNSTQNAAHNADNSTIANTAAFLSVGNNFTVENVFNTYVHVVLGLNVTGTINTTNIVLQDNCADGQVLKWSGGVGTCGTDTGGDSGDGGGNATASGTTNFIPYFFNATHLIQSLIYVAGETLSINYTSVNVTSTLYVNGANVTGTQIADNATIASNLSSLNTRLNTQIALQAANNATNAANESSLNARINTEVALQAANNATNAANESSLNARINTEVTLQAANNATQATNITSIWTFIFGNNNTIANTAAFLSANNIFTGLNTFQGRVNSTGNFSIASVNGRGNNTYLMFYDDLGNCDSKIGTNGTGTLWGSC